MEEKEPVGLICTRWLFLFSNATLWIVKEITLEYLIFANARGSVFL